MKGVDESNPRGAQSLDKQRLELSEQSNLLAVKQRDIWFSLGKSIVKRKNLR